MIRVKLADLIFDEYSQMGIMLLEDEATSRVLPIWIGLFETQAILFRLQNMYFPRPLTHDLFKNCLDMLGIKVEYVIVTTVKDNTYYAEIHLLKDTERYVLDSRPSDAVALAVRTESPIYVSEDVMNTAAMSKEEFDREQKVKH